MLVSLDNTRVALSAMENVIVEALLNRILLPISQRLYPDIGDYAQVLSQMEMGTYAYVTQHPLATTWPSDASEQMGSLLSDARYREAQIFERPELNISLGKRYLSFLIASGLPEPSATGLDTLHDPAALREISDADFAVYNLSHHRAHLGTYVAYFKETTDESVRLALDASRQLGHVESIMQVITKADVEEKILARIREKAQTLVDQRLKSMSGSTGLAAKALSDEENLAAAACVLHRFPDIARDYYETVLIPHTKDVEIAYILQST